MMAYTAADQAAAARRHPAGLTALLVRAGELAGAARHFREPGTLRCSLVELVVAAHADGYRLCWREATGPGDARRQLAGLLDAGAAPGQPWTEDDAAAIRRVMDLLEE